MYNHELFILEEEILNSLDTKDPTRYDFPLKEISRERLSTNRGYTLINEFIMINLSRIGIKNIPFTSYNLQDLLNLVQNMVILDLSKNKISQIEPIFEHFQHLGHLNLQYNKLTDLSYLSNNSLNFLQCSHNLLSDVSLSYQNLPHLIYIDLSNNIIEDFNVLETHDSLEMLNLASNKLNSLEKDLYNLPNLYSLSIAFNPIKSIDIEFIDFPNLRRLTIDKSQKKLINKSKLEKLGNFDEITII